MVIDRKSENGYEIKDSWCGVSGIVCGLFIHLTLIKQKRIDLRGKGSSNTLHRRCNLCTYKTTWCCSKCKDDDDLETLMFCVIQNLRECALLYIS